MRFPPEFWVYARWRDRGRPAPRPAALPKRIPASWRARYLLHRGVKPPPPPPPELGVFGESGVQFVNPAPGPLGPVEHCAGVARAGYAYASFEVMDLQDGRQKDWTIWFREAERNYLRQLPWGRCYTAADVERLCKIAQDWQQPPIVNLEDEAAGSLPPKVVAEIVKDRWGGEWGLQVLAQLYDQVDWAPVNDAVVILEAYANVMPWIDFEYLLMLARRRVDKVILSPGIYDYAGVTPTRAMYAKAPGPWLLFVGDNVKSWDDWRAP